MTQRPISAPMDLSHPITAAGPCTFVRTDQKPRATFQEGDSHGHFFLTSVLHDLPSNLCTHMDLKGHIVTSEGHLRMVGEYPVDHFIGEAVIIDVRDKMAALDRFFGPDGRSLVAPDDANAWGKFVETLSTLEISKLELMERVERLRQERELRGVIFFCDNARLWKPGKYNAVDYRYFFNVFLAERAAQWLVKLGVGFVGIDAFQLEDPIINFRGDESFLAKSPALRAEVLHRIDARRSYSNHRTLLSNEIAIFENLNLTPDLADTRGWFSGPPLNLHLDGLVDNALCRPVYCPEEREIA